MARILDFLSGRKGRYGGYELLEQVASGGMSTVWKVRHPDTGRIYAMKILTAQSVQTLALFRRLFAAEEGKIALGLDHPNVIKTLDYGQGRREEYYIVMEYVDGPNLATLIAVESPELRDRRFDLAMQMGAGLRYIHEEGLIHRDFCPKNVLYSAEGTAKIIDFGLTIPASLKARTVVARAGTASYMAPEQIRSQPVDARADIYSFGVSIFELLTGQHPFPRASDRGKRMQEHLNVEPPSLRQVAPELPEELEQVVGKCIAKERRLRYKTMRDVMEGLKAAVDIAVSRLA